MNEYNKQALEYAIKTEKMGRPLYFYPETDTTNDRIRELALEGAAEGTLAVAEMQTAARGRRGRAWQAPADSGIWMSLLLRPDIPPTQASVLTLLTGIALTEALEDVTGLEVGIKWPNDIVVAGKKICGILCEMKLDGTRLDYCVAGVGVNVGNQEFAEDIRDKATSLEEQLGGRIDREGLLQAILARFERGYEEFLHCEDLSFLREEYNAWLVNQNRQVRVLEPQGEYEGVAKGITPTGELLVECSDGQVQKVYAGEVSVRGLYGYV